MLSKDNNAVSAIIGVMLMVVITVVLAATIAMFSFNFTTIPKQNDVAIHVERIDATHIFIKNLGSSNTHHILFDAPGTPDGLSGETATGFFGAFNVTVNGIEISNFVSKGTANCTSLLGSMQYFSPVPENAQVNVIANYKDGTSYIAWQGTV